MIASDMKKRITLMVFLMIYLFVIVESIKLFEGNLIEKKLLDNSGIK